MKLSIAAGVLTRTLVALRPILKRWVYLNSRLGSDWARYSTEAPWWYNERASLSVFAGAVWTYGGWAVEEFSSTKRGAAGASARERSGRYDIDFAFGSHEYLAEAKQCWPRISSPSDAISRLRSTLKLASRDTKALFPEGLPVLSMVFAVPLVPLTRAQYTDDFIRAFLTAAIGLQGVAAAWSFPLAARRLSPPSSRFTFPGVALLVRLERKAA